MPKTLTKYNYIIIVTIPCYKTMSKRLFLVFVLVLTVGFFTRAFAFAQEVPVSMQSQSISRAEAVALLLNADPLLLERVRWFASHMPPLSLFSDVDQKQWYAPYLETAFEEGLVEGTTDGLFHPEDTLKEEEAIALVSHYKKTMAETATSYVTISTSQGNRLNKIVSEAGANNIKMPFPVRPGQNISRQNFFDMIASAGVQNPQAIVIAVIPVTTQFVATSQPIQPVTNQPVITNNPSTDDPNAAANASAKAFAISMPSLAIKDLTISHPTDLTHDGLLAPLQAGVGHLFSYPGQGGKILIYGHSSSYPWDVSQFTKIFRQINKLAVGDKVYITYNGTLYTYQVTFKQTVPAADTSTYQQEGKEELILYTCWPPDSIKQRYLVHADLVTTVAVK